MAYANRMLTAFLGAAVLMLGAGEAPARSGVAPGGFSAVRPIPNASAHPWFRHSQHRLANYWPGFAGYYGFAGDGGFADMLSDAPPAIPRDIRYTYTQDVPWDWAHRYPPNVAPSDRPYVSSCSTEPVTVPGRNGGDHTINITRCY